ncbi:2Fe-2S iron-sulfur cluster binding domain-containing protein [Loa loa]|uniref:2Fe-2S iron-sulfur cluster binding domain-containing protein n=2 Tax=Loa loa TaxID=7209 RepID=A0A1S0UC63_LOALO|nr:2Fe-2S iron-sulfur cluster binding domain-containing protein [Loa loa]EFO28351.2 2Fe-2S iron-sulfur cluster binding domain-containing protein [Loa loa]
MMTMIVRHCIRFAVCPQSMLQRGLAAREPSVKIRFKNRGETLEAVGKIGQSLYEVVLNADLPIDGYGACEGTLACCTCHVILEPEHYKRLPPPVEDELDLLDLAPEATDFSRLGCQVKLTEQDLPGVEVIVPSEVRDARAYD